MMPNCLRFVAAAIGVSALILPTGGAANDRMADARSGAEVPSGAVVRAQDTVTVVLDFAKLLRLERPASTIIIGGPEIIDATVTGASTIVLTGRAVGTTNIIILDDAGQEIASLFVQVVARGHPLVTVHHGTDRQTFSCIGPCKPVTLGQESPPEAAVAD